MTPRGGQTTAARSPLTGWGDRWIAAHQRPAVRPGRWKIGPWSSPAWRGIREQRGRGRVSRAERHDYERLCALEARYGPAYGVGGRRGAGLLLAVVLVTTAVLHPVLLILAGALLLGSSVRARRRPRARPRRRGDRW